MRTGNMLIMSAIITAFVVVVAPLGVTAAQAQGENMTMEELTNASLLQDNATMEELTNTLVENITGNMTIQNMTYGNMTA